MGLKEQIKLIYSLHELMTNKEMTDEYGNILAFDSDGFSFNKESGYLRITDKEVIYKNFYKGIVIHLSLDENIKVIKASGIDTSQQIIDLFYNLYREISEFITVGCRSPQKEKDKLEKLSKELNEFN